MSNYGPGAARYSERPSAFAGHVIYCNGCRHAWQDYGAVTMAAIGLADLMDQCSCVCTDETAPHYEDWVIDPPAETIPEGAWE